MTINERVQLDAINGKIFKLDKKQFEIIYDAAHLKGDYNFEFRQDCILFIVGTKTWGELQKYF